MDLVDLFLICFFFWGVLELDFYDYSGVLQKIAT